MKHFTIFTILILTFVNFSHQQTEIVAENNIAVQFIVQVERVPQTGGGHNEFLGVGTLLTFHHVLTTRSIYTNVVIPRDVTFRFRSNRLGAGFRAAPAAIVMHPSGDLAIARMEQRVNQQLTFAPRRRGPAPPMDRFCTMFGFNLGMVGETGQMLVKTAVVPRNTVIHCTPPVTGPFCATGSQFPVCNGFLGAPIICDGTNVTAMVISDQFCQAANPRAFFIVLQDFQQWINQETGGARGIYGGFSFIFAIISVVTVKIFV